MSENSSRRVFIKSMGQVAAVCLAPTIVPSSVLGKARTAPSDRITLGHIGVGGRGTALLLSFLQVDAQQSVAVCDPFESKRRERAKEVDLFYSDSTAHTYRGTKAYNDFRELLARPDIDAVVIATPDHWHVPIGLAAVRAGKDVYIEKPLGVSIHENQAMRQAVYETNKIFQYGTQQRSWLQFRFACELVRNGYIGSLHTIHAWCTDIRSQEQSFTVPVIGSQQPAEIPPGFDYDLWLGPAPWSPYTADRCTSLGTYHHYDNSLGFIAGWGAHPLDIAQWGNDTDDTVPVRYEGTGQINRGLFESVRSWDFECTYANGVNMRFMNESTAMPIIAEYHPAPRDHGTTFIGDEGWVSVDRYGIYAQPESLLSITLPSDALHLRERHNHYEHFVECVQTRLPSISPVNTAVQSDIISHLCDISIRVGRPISWDPQTETIIGDPEASRRMTRSLRSPWTLH